MAHMYIIITACGVHFPRGRGVLKHLAGQYPILS